MAFPGVGCPQIVNEQWTYGSPEGNLTHHQARTIAIAIALGAWGAAALAPLNQRPVSPLGDNQIEDNLQEILAQATIGGPRIDAVSDQISASLFHNDDCANSVMTRFADNSRIAENSIVGIYSSSDASARAVIFSGRVPPGTQATVEFRKNRDVLVNGTVVATGFVQPFGFFTQNTEEGSFFSEDVRNPSSRPQALIFRGNGTLLTAGAAPIAFGPGSYMVAFEDRAAGRGDSDYQDLIIVMSSIVPAGEDSSGGILAEVASGSSGTCSAIFPATGNRQRTLH